jgi:hypothetical protein
MHNHNMSLHEGQECSNFTEFKKARGRPQTARLTAGEQRACRAGTLDVPDRAQRKPERSLQNMTAAS